MGHREPIAALALTCEQDDPELARVLQVLLTPAEDLDPTAIRREAKKQGLGARPGSPYLDLLRLLAAWRQNRKRLTPPAALAAAARSRPLLSVAVDGLKGPGARNLPLARRAWALSPRVHPLWDAARYLQHDPEHDAPWSPPETPSTTMFPPHRWPDLRASHQHTRVADWLQRTPLDKRTLLVIYLHTLALQFPANEQRELLGMLLGRLHRELLDGHLEEAALLTRFGSSMAEHLELPRALRQQMTVLYARLHRLEDEQIEHPVLLRLAWQDDSFSPAERLELARMLIETNPEDPDAELDHAQAEAGLYRLGADIDTKERQALLVRFGARFDEHTLSATLPSDLPEAESLFLLAYHAVLRGHATQAMRLVDELLTHTHAHTATWALSVTEMVVNRSKPFRSKRLQRQILQPLGRLSEHPLPLEPLLALLISVREYWGSKAYEPVVNFIRPMLGEASPSAPGTPRALACTLVALLFTGHDDEANTRFRRWSRPLRKATDGSRDPEVFNTLVLLLGFGAGLDLTARVEPWGHTLLGFLLRSGPEPLAALWEARIRVELEWLLGMEALTRLAGDDLPYSPLQGVYKALLMIVRQRIPELAPLLQDIEDHVVPKTIDNPLLSSLLARFL